MQVISAMAHHGYLEQPGGEAMVEYIVQQCALPPETEVRGCPPPICSWAQELLTFCEAAWSLEAAQPQLEGQMGVRVSVCVLSTSLISALGPLHR